MKKIIKTSSAIFLLVLCLVGCGGKSDVLQSDLNTTQKSIEEQTREIYNDLIKAMSKSNFSEARSKISMLNQISEKEDISEIDKKTARCAYCYTCGIYKLLVSGTGVSGLQYPELMLIEGNMQNYARGKQLTEIDKTLELSESFFNAVNEVIK